MNRLLQDQLDDFIRGDDELLAQRALREGLRSLPPVGAPPLADGWQQIQNRLSSHQGNISGRQQHHGRWLRSEEWMGLAAVLIVAVLVIVFRPATNATMDSEQWADQHHAERQEWVVQSQQLENRLRLLRHLDSSQVMSGQQAVAVDELERMIGIVDLQLAASEAARAQAGSDPLWVNESTGLWQQRVLLLNELLASEFGETMRKSAEDSVYSDAAEQQI